MAETRQTTSGRRGFEPPRPGARYFLLDERRWTTYAEMTRGMDPEYLPRDERDLELLLTAMGALTEGQLRAAEELYESMLWAAAARLRVSVPRGVTGARSFEEAFPALQEVFSRRGEGLLAEALARMVASLDGEGAGDE